MAFVPWLWALADKNDTRGGVTVAQGAALGYLCGCGWYLGNCYWIYQTMYLYGGLEKPVAAGILLLFCLYLGIYHAVFAALFVAVRRSRLERTGALLLTPFVWVAVELARARITGFPWDLLGVTQVDNSLLMRVVPYTGAYGASFVVMALNTLWLSRLRLRLRLYTRPLLTAAGVAMVLCYAVLLRYLPPPARLATTATATLVQENLGVGTEATGNGETIPQLVDRFSRLSLYPTRDRCFGIPELASTRCLHFAPMGETQTVVPSTLIVWPEAPSGFFSDDPVFEQQLATLAKAAAAPLIVGSIGLEAGTTSESTLRKYDSAALVTAQGRYAGRYDKIHLVPWGEYIPFKALFFFANKLTAGVGDMEPGTERTVFRTGGHAYGVFICYESIFGDEVRRFVKNGAEVLVNISDDGWYGDTSAAWQHLNMVRMRAIENRRWVLRSTNTGVTAIIDPYGRVTASSPRHIRTSLHAGFNFGGNMTFYTRHGDWFAYGCALVTLAALGWSLLRKDELN